MTVYSCKQRRFFGKKFVKLVTGGKDLNLPVVLIPSASENPIRLELLVMFIQDSQSAYRILEVDPQADIGTIKKAYRRMATRYHPDKVNHLGPEFLPVAEEKFKAINEAYQMIRAERGI